MFITTFLGFKAEELIQLRILMDYRNLKSVEELKKELNGSYKRKLSEIKIQAEFAIEGKKADMQHALNEIIKICNKDD